MPRNLPLTVIVLLLGACASNNDSPTLDQLDHSAIPLVIVAAIVLLCIALWPDRRR
jgi:hypothetical protein